MDKKPFIGQLDRKIVLKQITTINNPIGENIETEIVFCNAYAMLTDVSGNETIDGKIIHLVDRIYTVRYRKEIAQRGYEMILVDGDEKFKITHIKLIGRRSYLVLNCSRSE